MQITRRAALLSAGLLGGAATGGLPAISAEAALEAVAPEAAAAPPPLPFAEWPAYIEREFSFKYPPGLLIIDDMTADGPRLAGDRQRENPIKAELRSGDNALRLTVATQQASAVKPTLFQVTDISQLGPPKQVAQLVVPPGATVTSYGEIAYEQAAQDTRTPLGKIQRQPRVVYRYSVQLPDDTHIEAAVAARLGKIFIFGCQAKGSDFAANSDALRQAADSFQIIGK